MRPAKTITAIILAVLGIVIVLVVYSYTQIQVSLDNVSFAGIDWAPSSISTVLKLGAQAVGGNILDTVLSLVTGVKLNLIFALSNHGVFPVYIPDLSYSLSINSVKIGEGRSSIDLTINPGMTKNVPVLQDFEISGIRQATSSIVDSGGMINLIINGTAYFKLLGLTVPVPFHSTKQISLIDEIRNNFAMSQN